MELKGLDEFKKRLNRMTENAKRIEGEHSVSYVDLFNDSFIMKNTFLDTSEEFFNRLNLEVGESIAKASEEELDIFAQSVSNFESWKELRGKAVSEYTLRKIIE